MILRPVDYGEDAYHFLPRRGRFGKPWPMADPRIIAIELDDETFPTHAIAADRERQVAIHDLLAGNSFTPRRPTEKGYGGPHPAQLPAGGRGLGGDNPHPPPNPPGKKKHWG